MNSLNSEKHLSGVVLEFKFVDIDVMVMEEFISSEEM